jgi:hypothetical protein
MRVNPKNLGGFQEIGVSLFLVAGIGGVLGATNFVSFFRIASQPVLPEKVEIAAEGDNADKLRVEQATEEIIITPKPGSCVAVLLVRPKKLPLVLLSSAKLSTSDSTLSNLTKKQKYILEEAQKYGDLFFVSITQTEPSPYEGQDLNDVDDLKKILLR